MPTKASVRTMTIHDGPSEEVLASLPPYGDDGHVSSRVVMALSDKEGERVVRCQLLLTRLVLEPEEYLIKGRIGERRFTGRYDARSRTGFLTYENERP